MESENNLYIVAPVNGQVVPLEQVPDPVFAGKVLGDGCAVIPNDGKIYSPVNGEVSTLVDTKHAYGFMSEDGLEVLVHFGIDTVSLKGEGFISHVKEGDKVKAGDLVAEVDFDLIKSKEMNPITPVLIYNVSEDKEMKICEGQAEAGKTKIISLEDKKQDNNASVAEADGKITLVSPFYFI